MPIRRTPRKLLRASRRLRHESTRAERILWQHLRARKLGGAKFRRQRVIGPYVVDFVCLSAWLIVELDGAVHRQPEVKRDDIRRQQALESEGFRVLRFTNDALEGDLPLVLAAIERALVADA